MEPNVMTGSNSAGSAESDRAILTPRAGTPVYGRDGTIGTVAGTRYGMSGLHQDYLLVRLTSFFGLFHSTRLVPAAWIHAPRSDATRITLDATRAQVAACPLLRTDADIRADVVETLSETGGFFQVPAVRAKVAGGVVRLSGHFAYLKMQRTALSDVRAIPGVLAIDDRSDEDSALTISVAQALTQDPDTRAATLVVTSHLGEVHLNGTVPSTAVKQKATALAQAVPGVTHVHNEATVLPAPVATNTPGPRWAASHVSPVRDVAEVVR